ncbi:MAG: PAS domain S-box protein [Ignavibacteria bacterium]|nr:PAS domain S-box protein [Ignavibacteria bacterium]
MTAGSLWNSMEHVHRIARLWLILPVALAVLALIGWISNLTILAQGFVHLNPMAPSTAVLLILVSCQIYFHSLNHEVHKKLFIRQLINAAILTLIILLIPGVLIQKNYSLEQLFGIGMTGAGRPAELMAPITLFIFFVHQLTVYLGVQPNFKLKNFGATIVSLVLLLILGINLGYAFDLSTLSSKDSIAPSLSASIAFVGLLISTLLIYYPTQSPVQLFMGNSFRAGLLRKILPGSIILMVLTGWVSVIIATRATGYIVLLPVIILLAVVLWIFFASRVAKTESGLFESEIMRREATEAELKYSHELDRSLYSTGAVGIAETRADDGTFLKINKKFAEILGYPEDELLHKSFREITYVEDIDKSRESLERLLNGVTTEEILSKRYIRKDGSLVWVELDISLLHKEEKRIQSFIVIIRDLTGEKQIEDELQRRIDQNEEQAAIIESSSLAYLTGTRTGRIINCNLAFTKLTGFTINEVQSCNWLSQLTPAEFIGIDKNALDQLDRFGVPVTYRKELIKKDRSHVPVEVLLQKISSRESEVSYLNMHFTDISRTILAEAEIMRLNRINDFISKLNQRIARVANRNELFQQLCEIAVEYGKFKLAWVGLVDDKKNEIIPHTTRGSHVRLFSSIHAFSLDDTELGQTTSAIAIRDDRCAVCNDFSDMTLVTSFREQALANGLAASISVPIKENGNIIGVFTLYSTEAHYFGEHEVMLIAAVASDIDFKLDSLHAEELRQKAEQELYAARQLASRIFETSPAGIIFIDENGRIIFVNRQIEEMFRLPKEKIFSLSLGTPGLILSEVNGAIVTKEYVRRILLPAKDKTLNELKLSIFLPNGGSLIVSVNVSLTFSDHGDFLGAVLMVNDISESLSMKEKLFKREELLSLTGRMAKVGGWEYNPENRSGTCTEECYAIHGLPTQDVFHLEKFLELYQQEHREQFTSAINLIKETLTPFYLELQITTPKGELKWMFVAGHPIIANGRLALIIGIFQDITARKLAEDSLIQRSKELEVIYYAGQQLRYLKTVNELSREIISVLEGIIDFDYCAILLHDQVTNKLVPTAISNGVEILFGSEIHSFDANVLDVAVGEGIIGWVAANGRSAKVDNTSEDSRYKKIKDAVRSELCVPLLVQEQVLGVVNLESHLTEAFTTTDLRILETLAVHIATAIQNAILFDKISQELEHSKAIEAELVVTAEKADQMNRLKSTFLANMSHELRTPMIGILGYSEIMESPSFDEEVREMSGLIRTSARRLMDTLNLLLDLSKIEAENLDLCMMYFDCVLVIKDLCEVYDSIARKKQINLTYSAPATSIMIMSEPQLFRTIIHNVLDNALKFTPAGEVNIEIEQQGKEPDSLIIIRVSDTGIGIAPEKITTIWEAFRQGSEGISRLYEGSGLGLTITKGFVERLGGQISVASEVGKGSIFSIVLPSGVNRGKNIQYPMSNSKLITPSKEKNSEFRVLYVDDDDIAVDFMQRVLKPICKLDYTGSGEEALEMLNLHTYHAVLMDVNLGGGIDGLEVTRRIRGNSDINKLPVIAVTAYAMPGDEKEILESGCDYYFSKPFQIDSLKELLIQIFHERDGR